MPKRKLQGQRLPHQRRKCTAVIQDAGFMEDFKNHAFKIHRGSWGNAEAEAKPKIAIVQKPCYIELTCRLPYESLVETINACLQKKNESFCFTRLARTFQKYVFHKLLIHEKLNYSLSIPLLLMCAMYNLPLYAPRNVQTADKILLHRLKSK